MIDEFGQSELAGRALVWLDDNYSQGDIQFDSIKNRVLVITNRFDSVQQLESEGIDVRFSDFKLPSTERKFSGIFYRVSKERLVSHRVINQSVIALKKKAQFVLVGRKEDGIKTYYDKCIKQLGLDGSIKKHRDCYVCLLNIGKERPTELLDDGNYKSLRESYCLSVKGKTYTMYSKPGVYSWKKPDLGTQFLIDSVDPIIPSPIKSKKALDLGCGSGHLTLALHALGYKNITATDNNAAAVKAVIRTVEENKVKASVITSDAGSNIADKFDLILCNPPFHKGFETDKALTEKFVRACKHLLLPDGAAYLVTNAFIGIEKEIFNAGLSGKQIANNKQFKILKIKNR